ncbi:Beta-N-acetylhexosaminidase [Nocardiopsis dassonvillei]|uniref:family 20 glycosylhydrolase n=1 Tax=Nocardiopsis dassonvillei TaxID=2014 RepID=UPI003F56ACF3
MPLLPEAVGLVPPPVTAPAGPPVLVGSGRRITLSGAPADAAAWFADLAGRLHGVRVEEVAEGGDVHVARGGVTEVPPAAGIDPRSVSADERHRVDIAPGGVRVTAASDEAAFRALTALAQVLHADGTVHAPGGTLADGPRYAWRGLSLDVARHFFTAEEVRRIIDLLALYRFSVLHLHLTDNEGWRVESAAWPRLTAGGPHYTRAGFAELVEYAARRYVTVVPEVDLPGHTGAAFDAYPELQGDLPVLHPRVRFLHPDVPAARDFARDVIEEFASLSPGPFLHIGGDEPFGMEHGDYVRFVRHAHACARAAGKRVVAWQEAARAGVMDGEDVLQYWIGAPDEFDPESIKRQVPEEFHALVDRAAETFRISPGDVPAGAAAGVPVLVSPNSVLYLDRPYAEPAAAEQEGMRARLGLPAYPPITREAAFDWDPGRAAPDAAVAGVEAAVWGETLTGFDDLAFLLLPRLAGVAEKAWSLPTTWESHARRLSGHERHWAALGFGAHYRPG